MNDLESGARGDAPQLDTPGPETAPQHPQWRVRDRSVIAIICAVAFALRLFPTRGLWLDEGTSLFEAKLSYAEMLNFLSASDVHPPLYFSILWAQIRVFGTSELAVRFPSIVIGTVTVAVLYCAARDLFDRKTGYFVALIACFAPVMVWYSQEARMYALFILFATVAVWAQVRVIRGGGATWWLCFAVASALMMWTHYFAVLPILVQQGVFVATIINRQREGTLSRPFLNNWVRSLMALAILIAPMVSMMLNQAAAPHGAPRSSAESDAPGARFYSAETAILSSVIGYQPASVSAAVNSFWPLILLLPMVALGRKVSRLTLALLGLVAIPFVVLSMLTVEGSDLLEVRYFAGAVPVVLLIGARLAAKFASTTRRTVMATAVIVLSLGLALGNQQLAYENPRVYDYETVLTAVDRGRHQGDLLVYEPAYLKPVVDYYAPNIASMPLEIATADLSHIDRVILVSSLSFAEENQNREAVQSFLERQDGAMKTIGTASARHVELRLLVREPE